MKAFTDISQSKKLAEILPRESADMYYDVDSYGVRTTPEVLVTSVVRKKDIPCWSLSALLKLIPDFPVLTQEDVNEWKIGVPDYNNNDEYIEIIEANPIDACYKMILKLKELKIL